MRQYGTINAPVVSALPTWFAGQMVTYSNRIHFHDWTSRLKLMTIWPRIASTASSGTPTPNADTTDEYILTALAADATFGAQTAATAPDHGQKLIIRIKDNGTSRALSRNAIYRAIGVTLPTATTISKTLYVGCIYNSTDTKRDVVAVAEEA